MKVARTASLLRDLLTGWIRSHRRPCNVAAFHQGRSGSRVLGDLLRQHPRVVWDGELLSPGRRQDMASRWPWLPRDPLRILRLRMILAGASCYGLETQPTQLEHLELSLAEYVHWLKRVGFSRFLMLERKNHLRRIVSMLIARRTSQWHLESGQKAPLVRVTLDVHQLRLERGRDTESRSLVAQLQQEQESWSRLRQTLDSQPSLYLCYEEDLAVSPRDAYRNVCRFLGLEEYPAVVRFARTNPYPLRDVLANYAEVESALSGTPFEWMLDS